MGNKYLGQGFGQETLLLDGSNSHPEIVKACSHCIIYALATSQCLSSRQVNDTY